MMEKIGVDHLKLGKYLVETGYEDRMAQMMT